MCTEPRVGYATLLTPEQLIVSLSTFVTPGETIHQTFSLFQAQNVDTTSDPSHQVFKLAQTLVLKRCGLPLNFDHHKNLPTRYLKLDQVLKKLTIEHEKIKVEDDEVTCVMVRDEVRRRTRGARDSSSDSSASSCSESSEENKRSNHQEPEVAFRTKDHKRRVLKASPSSSKYMNLYKVKSSTKENKLKYKIIKQAVFKYDHY